MRVFSRLSNKRGWRRRIEKERDGISNDDDDVTVRMASFSVILKYMGIIHSKISILKLLGSYH